MLHSFAVLRVSLKRFRRLHRGSGDCVKQCLVFERRWRFCNFYTQSIHLFLESGGLRGQPLWFLEGTRKLLAEAVDTVGLPVPPFCVASATYCALWAQDRHRHFEIHS